MVLRLLSNTVDTGFEILELGMKFIFVSGQLVLIRPISDLLSISHTGQPILINVTAEEIRVTAEEAPAQSTSVQLALIPPGVTAASPVFGALEYNTVLNENSPTGSVLDLTQANLQIQPGDVVALELQNNNGKR